MFAGRKEEIKRLLGSFKRDKGTLCVIRGRRRIGKTRLIRELPNKEKSLTLRYLTSAPPQSGASDDHERKQYAEQVKAEFGLSYMPPHNTWRELFSFVADACSEKKTVLAIDEVNWLATRSQNFIPVLFELWERQFSTKPQFMLILSGSLASWMEENILMNKGFVGRVSVSITLRELELRDMKEFFGARLQRTPTIDVIKMLSAVGGVPRYLEELDLRKTAETNLEQLALNEASMLYDEFEKMFHDLFSKENKFYKNILEAVSGSSQLLTPKALSSAMGLSYSGRTTKALKILTEVGFLRLQKTWDLSTRKLGTASVVRINDNYTAFYFRAILRQKHLDNQASGTLRNLPSLLGLQFENLVYHNRQFVFEQLNINPNDVLYAGNYLQTPTAKRKGCQIGFLIHVKNRVYVCECKLSGAEIPASVMAEVDQKISRLQHPRGVSFHPVLIHGNTVSESVIDADFFDAVIDMGDGVAG